MSEWKLPIEGSCLCGTVRLRIQAPPLVTMACHCAGCQKMTSSAYSLSVGFPTEAVEVTGELELGGEKREDVRQYFCPSCKSWVLSRMTAIPTFTNVRTTLLDDPARFAPFVEIWVDARLPFTTTGATKSYPKFPEMDEFEPLLKAYAESLG